VEEEMFGAGIFGVDDVLGLESDPVAVVGAHVGTDRKKTAVIVINIGEI
jgi:hypothetical protein